MQHRIEAALSTAGGDANRPVAVRAACFLAAVAFAGITFAHFHNRQWNGYDDGAYLHVADCVLHGQVLNRDVQDIHAGYINLVNALALKVFGNNAVSLRYPLAVIGVASAALAFWLLSDRGVAAAAAGSVAVTCLSSIQFMNPSAHWYALFLTLVTVAVVAKMPPAARGRAVLVGFLLGVIFLFRQLTGVLVAIPVTLYLLQELPQRGRGNQTWAAKGVVALMAVGLGAFLVRNVEPVALGMYAVWPLAVLAWCGWRVAAVNRDVGRRVAGLAAGAALAAAPLVGYHVYHGSVGAWLDDTVFSAAGLYRLRFFDEYRYWWSMVAGAKSLLRPGDLSRAPQGLFWLVAPLLPTMLGLVVVRSIWTARDAPAAGDPAPERNGWAGRPPVPILPLTALFYFLVALHLQKWMYFFFGGVSLTAMGVLAMAPAAGRVYRGVALGLVWGLSAAGLLFLAGPIPRLLPGGGVPHVPPRDHGVPRCGIWLEAPLAATYRDIVALVEREVEPGAPILVLPLQPELYYLTDRPSPIRFYGPAFFRSPEDLESVLRTLQERPPRLVFHNPLNAYGGTAEGYALMEWVTRRYDEVGTYGPIKAYRYRGAPLQPAAPPPATVPVTAPATATAPSGGGK